MVLFNSASHKYLYEGETVPSVTTILSIISKPALVSWAANMAVDSMIEGLEAGRSYDELQLQSMFDKARKAHTHHKVTAGNIGTIVHEWIEDYINGKKPKLPVNEDLRESVEQFLKWQEDNKVKFLLSEQVVFSKKYRYIGTLDFLCTIDGEPYIGDTKTSNALYPEYLLQTSAYRQAREEEFPKEKYSGQVIVRVGKTGDFEVKTIKKKSDYEKTLQAFLHARELYMRLAEIEDAFFPRKRRA